MSIFRAVLLALWGCFGATWAAPPPPPAPSHTPYVAQTQRHRLHRVPIDHSGKTKKGKASHYSRKSSGETMANGKPMNPASNAAASKTLPLGTTAKVTNLENGKSAVVKIEDRGPYVKGRIVDLTPKTARQLGMGEAGVAPVEVAPIEVPQLDGSVKRGAAPAQNGH